MLSCLTFRQGLKKVHISKEKRLSFKNVIINSQKLFRKFTNIQNFEIHSGCIGRSFHCESVSPKKEGSAEKTPHSVASLGLLCVSLQVDTHWSGVWLMAVTAEWRVTYGGVNDWLTSGMNTWLNKAINICYIFTMHYIHDCRFQLISVNCDLYNAS